MGKADMKRKVAALTDVELRKAKPREKDYKLSDGKGLEYAQCRECAGDC